MQFYNDGIKLWYGTDETPAPQGNQVSRERAEIMVGVSPAHPSNRVIVQYCVDDGTLQTVFGIPTQIEHGSGTQFFRAIFPPFMTGKQVQYRVILYCSGRQVPNIKTAQQFTGAFGLKDPSMSESKPSAPQPAIFTPICPQFHKGSRFPVNLEFLATMWIQLQKPPEIIGNTPEGLKINWYIAGGQIDGPKLNAIVRPEGGDWMTLRSDGIGILGIHVTLETPEGALILTEYSGVFELGEDGYQRFSHILSQFF